MWDQAIPLLREGTSSKSEGALGCGKFEPIARVMCGWRPAASAEQPAARRKRRREYAEGGLLVLTQTPICCLVTSSCGGLLDGWRRRRSWMEGMALDRIGWRLRATRGLGLQRHLAGRTLGVAGACICDGKLIVAGRVFRLHLYVAFERQPRFGKLS